MRDWMIEVSEQEYDANKQVGPTPIYGVNALSPLIALPKFDIVKGFVPDYMHSILLGVGAQFTDYFIKSMTKYDIALIDSIIPLIKATHQVTRLTRTLSERKDWKAREWENWILYYSLPVLQLVVRGEGTEKLQHWALLVRSLHILLRPKVTVIELDQASQMLELFVETVLEKKYPITCMTFNVHQLLHITDSVKDWGPLWSHSTFPFESGNKEVLKAIQCAKGVTQQIVRYLNSQRVVLQLEKIVYPSCSPIVKEYCENIGSARAKKCYRISDIVYFGKEIVIKYDILTRFHLSTNNTRALNKMVKDGCLYTSSTKVNPRSCNYYAQLDSGTFLELYQFIVDESQKKEYTICKIVETELYEYSSKIKKVSKIGDRFIMIKTEEIKKVCVFMQIHDTQYLSAVPNLYYY